MDNLRFDFAVDKTNNTVLIQREFSAEQQLVWNAFTTAELLDQWWAPKPYLSKTKAMNFEEGGRRFYAMVGPEGQEHWSVQKFISISPIHNVKWLSSFVDKDENINADFPTSEWDLSFSEQNGTTTVSITIKHKTFADIEMMLQMGFKEGFTVTLNELARLVQKLSK